MVCVEDLTKSPRGNYLWKEVRPGLIELPCQYGEEGKARRHCNKNGKWEEVNLEECFGETKDLFPYLEKVRHSLIVVASLVLPHCSIFYSPDIFCVDAIQL